MGGRPRPGPAQGSTGEGSGIFCGLMLQEVGKELFSLFLVVLLNFSEGNRGIVGKDHPRLQGRQEAELGLDVHLHAPGALSPCSNRGTSSGTGPRRGPCNRPTGPGGG